TECKILGFLFFSSRRRHTRFSRDWSSDVCSSDLRLMIENDAACVVLIPKGFEKDVLTKQYPEITTIVNTSNVLTANYASGALQVVLGTLKVGTQIETLRKQGTPE